MTQKIQLSTLGIALGAGLLFFLFAWGAPASFPVGSTFLVSEGESLVSVSNRLEESKIISSALLFRGWVSLIGRDTDISLGEYRFNSIVPLGSVISKFINGPDRPLLAVTVPEGSTTIEVAQAFEKALPTFSVTTFEGLVKQKGFNGYLFPSTYHPLPSYEEKNIIELMRSTFDQEYDKHFKDILFPKHVTSKLEVVTLASILEGEAKTQEDMKIVSGILQTRLEKGMRLQVDVAEETYSKTGLPLEPINNPGIVAMDAVFHPIASPYLYYLTGQNGTMHYSKTFDEHKKKIQLYLK